MMLGMNLPGAHGRFRVRFSESEPCPPTNAESVPAEIDSALAWLLGYERSTWEQHGEPFVAQRVALIRERRPPVGPAR
jgi:hypothetical protein